MIDDGERWKGLDVVWLAVDSCDRVAAFVTAGDGPIPAASVDAVEDSEKRVCALPACADHQILESMPRPDSFIALARRGLFVYDWTGARYELIAVPQPPLIAGNADAAIRERALLARLPHVHFGLPVIEVSSIGI